MPVNAAEAPGLKFCENTPPFIIAEMSGNHNQSLDRALEIVRKAAQAGADALKLQTFTPDAMTLNINGDDFMANPDSIWKGRNLYELYQEAVTPWEWHKPIFDLCRELGMVGFSSPFDEAAIDFLETLDVPCYKIASFECVDLPLIRKAASTGKPLIISTGMASVAEIAEAVDMAREAGCSDVVLLKCTSTYPASPENSNLRTIPHMRELFGCAVGLSDHTMGIGVPIAAVASGATVIEKHFTLSRAEGGIDSAFSLEPHELASMVEESHRAWQAMGQVQYGPTKVEEKAKLRRRSLYIASDLKAGDTLTPQSLRRIRPGLGLPPKYYDLLIGQKVTKDVKAGTPVSWDMFR